MSSTADNFTGNLSALDFAAALTLVGLSRVVEIPYTSSPADAFIGNFVPCAQLRLSLGSGSRVVELAYTSALGN